MYMPVFAPMHTLSELAGFVNKLPTFLVRIFWRKALSLPLPFRCYTSPPGAKGPLPSFPGSPAIDRPHVLGHTH